MQDYIFDVDYPTTNPFTNRYGHLDSHHQSHNQLLDPIFPCTNPFLRQNVLVDATNPFLDGSDSFFVDTISKDTIPNFNAQMVASKFGKHETAVYNIPGTTDCYSFYFKRNNKDAKVFECTGCKYKGRATSVKVGNGCFSTNPAELNHICQRLESAKVFADHFVYEKLAPLRHQKGKTTTPRAMWASVLQDLQNTTVCDKDAIEESFYGGGPAQRRQAFSRAINSTKNPHTTMEYVSESLSHLPGGSLFLQFRSDSYHVYYNCETINAAVSCGLNTLLCDGIHSLQPKSLGRGGQMYSIHGASDDFCVPLLYAVSATKTAKFYKSIFEMLRKELDRSGCCTESLRVVLDFEQASIKSAKAVFNGDNVEGCSFHLSQAWNRMRDKTGLKQYCNEDPVQSWYRRISALLFLPQDSLSSCAQLLECPVLPSHPAHTACQKFLTYFKTTWLDGPYANIWSKHDITNHRTTNLVEAFHRKISSQIGVHHPALSVLIGVLQALDKEAHLELRRHQRGFPSSKQKRKHDIERQVKVKSKMVEFQKTLDDGGATYEDILDYLDQMSVHVTSKSYT